jgi:hypothetical protein
MAKSELVKVMTPKFRVSFPNVFKAKAIEEGQDPKFSMAMLFDDEADLSAMKKAAQDAIKAKWPDKSKRPKGLRNPFRDATEKLQFEGYEEGITFVTASSKQKPGLVDQQRDDILDYEDFYAGCYARATLLAFPYDTMGNKGVSFLLSNIQKLADGEPLSGKTKAKDDFDAVDAGEDSSSDDGDEDFDL